MVIVCGPSAISFASKIFPSWFMVTVCGASSSITYVTDAFWGTALSIIFKSAESNAPDLNLNVTLSPAFRLIILPEVEPVIEEMEVPLNSAGNVVASIILDSVEGSIKISLK